MLLRRHRMAALLNRDNFTEMTRPHWARMHRFATRLCGDPDRGADLVQEALVKAIASCARYDGRLPLAPWLMEIVRNAFRDQLRRAERRPEAPVADANDLVGDVGPDALARALIVERADQLEGHLAAIPDDFREVLILVDVEDLSYEEAAQVCGVPVGTVRSRLYRGRAVLRKLLLENRELF